MPTPMEEAGANEDVARLLAGERAWKLEHGEAVATGAYRTARAIGLSRRVASRIRLAARLHDIGKAEIDERILLKPEPLTMEEWSQIRLHAVAGEQILLGAGLTDIAPWVRSHHERFDGLGYPDGLAGNAIPLASRIIAVADAYDAMTSTLPYRPAMSPRDAREELHRNAGTQFDPEVVATFLRAHQPTFSRCEGERRLRRRLGTV